MTLALPSPEPIINVAAASLLDGITNRNTLRSYTAALQDFQEWWFFTGQEHFTKATVNAYKKHLTDEGVGFFSINKRLAAIRKLAVEAADNHLMSHADAEAIGRVDNIPIKGNNPGNWLTRDDAQALIDAPDAETIIGVRDRAMLGVLIGCGLRRDELVHMRWEDIQQREARWVVDIPHGKGNKRRMVPMASWTKVLLDEWWEEIEAWGLDNGCVFLRMNKGGDIIGPSISGDAVRNVVIKYTNELDIENISPHDLRRTFAKLAYKGGADILQISMSLGHDSVETTKRYIGAEQDLNHAPCDVLGLGGN